MSSKKETQWENVFINPIVKNEESLQNEINVIFGNQIEEGIFQNKASEGLNKMELLIDVIT